MTTIERSGGLAGAVAAEWTKFWSVRATWWCLIAGTALMLLYSTLLRMLNAAMWFDQTSRRYSVVYDVGSGVNTAETVQSVVTGPVV